jgi:micrococcal nuclease
LTEFDTNDPVNVCLKKHRGNYGRLICYVHKGEENYNLRAVLEGYSPYFLKYGRSREYHKEFVSNEAKAQAENRIIWNPETNQGGKTREYTELIPWWSLRAMAVEDYRKQGLDSGALSIRIDYETIQDAAKNEQ